jgi:hypothetical protein
VPRAIARTRRMHHLRQLPHNRHVRVPLIDIFPRSKSKLLPRLRTLEINGSVICHHPRSPSLIENHKTFHGEEIARGNFISRYVEEKKSAGTESQEHIESRRQYCITMHSHLLPIDLSWEPEITRDIHDFDTCIFAEDMESK